MNDTEPASFNRRAMDWPADNGLALFLCWGDGQMDEALERFKTPGGHQLQGLHVFADGCYDPVSGHGGWGFVAYLDGVEHAFDFGGSSNSTNNTMELLSLFNAIGWINRESVGGPATIWLDSVYAVNGCNIWRPIWRNNGWRKVRANPKVRNRKIADAELWRNVDRELLESRLITIAWCKGHSGIYGNERADALADLGRLSLRANGDTKKLRNY